jgi:hypothetical protein
VLEVRVYKSGSALRITGFEEEIVFSGPDLPPVTFFSVPVPEPDPMIFQSESSDLEIVQSCAVYDEIPVIDKIVRRRETKEILAARCGQVILLAGFDVLLVNRGGARSRITENDRLISESVPVWKDSDRDAGLERHAVIHAPMSRDQAIALTVVVGFTGV